MAKPLQVGIDFYAETQPSSHVNHILPYSLSRYIEYPFMRTKGSYRR